MIHGKSRKKPSPSLGVNPNSLSSREIKPNNIYNGIEFDEAEEKERRKFQEALAIPDLPLGVAASRAGIRIARCDQCFRLRARLLLLS